MDCLHHRQDKTVSQGQIWLLPEIRTVSGHCRLFAKSSQPTEWRSRLKRFRPRTRPILVKVFRIPKVPSHKDGGSDQQHALATLIHPHMLHLSPFVRLPIKLTVLQSLLVETDCVGKLASTPEELPSGVLFLTA